MSSQIDESRHVMKWHEVRNKDKKEYFPFNDDDKRNIFPWMILIKGIFSPDVV